MLTLVAAEQMRKIQMMMMHVAGTRYMTFEFKTLD